MLTHLCASGQIRCVESELLSKAFMQCELECFHSVIVLPYSLVGVKCKVLFTLFLPINLRSVYSNLCKTNMIVSNYKKEKRKIIKGALPYCQLFSKVSKDSRLCNFSPYLTYSNFLSCVLICCCGMSLLQGTLT